MRTGFGRPEHELMLCFARVAMAPEQLARAQQLLEGGIDWTYALAYARRNRLWPLLHQHLAEHFPLAVPAAMLDGLRREAKQVVARNLLRTGELVRVLKLFRARGVETLSLKGPTLAAATYGDLGIRPFDDLDVLVRREDLMKCRDLLVAQGYRPDPDLPEEQLKEYLNRQFAYSLVRNLNGICIDVELHWTLTHRAFSFLMDTERLWRRAVTLEMAGSPVRVLSPEDLLLFLCVHGAKHEWCQIMLLCDVAELLRAEPDLDWAYLQELARHTRAERMLHLGLYLAHHLLGAALPRAVADRMAADPVLHELAALVARWLFLKPEQPPTNGECTRFHLKVREKLRDRLPMYLHSAGLIVKPNGKDRAFVNLPSSLYFLYYLIRPVRTLVHSYRR